VGYTGKVGISNGLATLVDAASLLHERADIGLAIIGSGTYRDELAARAKLEGLDNIVFIPPVPKERIPHVLSELDVCYLGLRNKPVFQFGISPTKLFDYMAASKPVIMGIRAGNDPVREAGCGLTISPEDPAALATAVRTLADLPEGDLAHMGAAGRAFLESNHDWSVLGKRYVEILGLGQGIAKQDG
jgi:glycosyltransferase involved in cell wall biosynthesis